MTIWQQADWPQFKFDTQQVQPKLDQVLTLQNRLLGEVSALPDDLGKTAELDALIQSAIKTSEIEGEYLNVESVRSSVARQLGFEQAGLPEPARREAALVEMLLAAVNELNQPLTEDMLCAWQAALFAEPSVLRELEVGRFRDDAKGPMQVVSVQRGQTTVHYEAPPAESLASEMQTFFQAYNQSVSGQHGIIRAAIAHFYFVSIHPFDDGNGRVARALTDRALAQSEQTGVRFYSLSAAIEKNKEAYYHILEATQNCRAQGQQQDALNITDWLVWFLDVLGQAIEGGLLCLERVLLKSHFWKSHAQVVLSERQVKVLNRLLDGYGLEFTEGIAARHYKGMAGVSKATATRDLADLLAKGCLRSLDAGGRSVRYVINQ